MRESATADWKRMLHIGERWMVISSRTPEGTPSRCPICGTDLKIESSDPAGDAPCPCCGHLLWFTREEVGGAQIIKPTGNLLSSESLDQLFESVEVRPGMQLVLDFRGVQYVTSAVLGKLINLKKKVAVMRGMMRLRGIHPDLEEVFRITRLDQVFEIEA
jgi:anti-anti-sigma factor